MARQVLEVRAAFPYFSKDALVRLGCGISPLYEPEPSSSFCVLSLDERVPIKIGTEPNLRSNFTDKICYPRTQACIELFSKSGLKRYCEPKFRLGPSNLSQGFFHLWSNTIVPLL